MNLTLIGGILTTVALLVGNLAQQLLKPIPTPTNTGLQSPTEVRALEKTMRAQWADSPQNADVLIKLSNAYRDSGNLDQSINCLKIALNLLQKNKQPDTWKLAISRNNFALLMYIQGTTRTDKEDALRDYEEAFSSIGNAFKLVRTSHDTNLPSVIDSNWRYIELAKEKTSLAVEQSSKLPQ